MDAIPEYLFTILDAAGDRREGLDRGERFGGDAQDPRVDVIRPSLEEWAADRDFWGSARGELNGNSGAQGPHKPAPEEVLWHLTTPDFRDRETAMLKGALSARSADPELADSVMANLRIPRRRPRVEDALVVVILMPEEAEGLTSQRKTLRYLRKAFKVAAGGLLIAVDITNPDPTGLTKVASIAGGLATIVG